MKKNLLYVLPCLLTIAACAQNIGSSDYSYSSVGQVSNAIPCTVLSVRQVNVQSNNGTGTVVGGVAGGLAGSTIGRGSSATILGALGGAAIGAVAGNAAESSLSSQTGFEYIVKTDNGQTYSITQGADNLVAAGQRCMLINGNPSRVIAY